MNDEKTLFRIECLKKRNQIPQAEKEAENQLILEHLKAFMKENKIHHYLCYIHYKSEVETIPFVSYLLEQGIHVYAPKVSGDTMDFYKIESLEDLETGYQGILEPKEDEHMLFQELVPSTETVCMILPGCGFDRKGNRMGYGGGYYDKYLSKWENKYDIRKVAVAYEIQIVDDIPHKSHDHRVNYIITKKGCSKCLI